MPLYDKECGRCGHRVGDKCILAGTDAFVENHFNRKCDRNHSGWTKRPSVFVIAKQAFHLYFAPLVPIWKILKEFGVWVWAVFVK